MRNLIVVAHYDDEVLGCSSIINCETDILVVCGADIREVKSRQIEKEFGCKYHYLKYTPFELQRIPRDSLNAEIGKVINDLHPVNVFTHTADLHIDHRIVNEAVMVACRSERSDISALYTFDVRDFKTYDAVKHVSPEIKNKLMLIYSKYINNFQVQEVLKFNEYLAIKNNISYYAEGFNTVFRVIDYF